MQTSTNQCYNNDSKEAADYLSRFPYCIHIDAGRSYDPRFKELVAWCNQTMGIKFKDWFLISTGNTTYRLHMRDSKYGMFLSLKYADIITGSNLLCT